MRIKTFILLLCLGLVLSSVAWADVDSVFFTINSNGQIIEAGTSGTDADPELLQELAEQSQDTSEEPLVVAPETEEESAPVVPSLRGLENTSSGTGDEDDNITDTDGETESDSNELNPCEAAGGTGDVSNCICESGGTFMLGNDDIYRCCKDNAPYVLDDRAYSAVPLIPQCGCNAPSIWGMTLREPYMDGAEKVCCRGKNRVWSSQMGTTGYQEELDEDNCGCPAAAEGATAIIGKTTSNGFYCCQGSKYLQDKKSWQISYTYCGCSDNQAKCATQAMCEAAVQEYDKNWFWCETEKKCVTQGYDCACPAGQEKENGQCVKVCSEQYPELCSDVVACLRAQGNWCYVITDGTVSDNWVEIGENLAESTGVIEECRRDPCCPDGQQQAADGQCYSCPNDGMLFYQASDEEEGTYICCKTTDDTPEPAGQVYDSTNKIWRYDSACGCPIINNKAGENKEGICCYNGYALETKNNVTDYSSADYFSVCDCPDDGVWMESTKVCCKAGKPFDSTTQTYASTRDLAKCGCISEEETEVRSGNNTFCCKEGRVVIPTDVTPVPDVGVCQCGSNTPVWDSTQNMCVKCLTNNHCSGATPRCYTDSEHPENNTCVACTNDSECGENLICDSTSKTCVACAEGFYQRGACRECLQDEHCQGRTDGKNYCDPDTLTCETCVLHSSTSHADAGCDPNKKYCVSSYVTAEGQTKSQRLCSQCVSNTDCTGGQKCNLTMGKCVDPCPNGMVPDAQGTCPELGECDPNSATPVWDIYKQKCVHCYDSIFEDWTDLGCPDVTDESYKPWDIETYNTRQYVGNKQVQKRICLVTKDIPLGKCVECLKDSHCQNGYQCVNYMCTCAANWHYIASLKTCVECTANYGAVAKENVVAPCAASKPYCDLESHKCFECNANYQETGTGKVACSSEALPICNQTTHTCEACPASKASYSTSDHVCVACDSNSNYDKSSGKCVCKEGYGVVNNKCVDAGTAKIQGDAVSGCKSQACQSAKVFEFTTVQNMLYELTFEGTISYGDWAKFQCEGAILDTTSSSETNGKTTKQWCSDHKARDTNPDDTQYCSCASSDKSCKKCYNDGKGLENNKGCARGTITTSQDNVKFLGDGKKCTFTAVNGNGDCTAACAISDKGSISVVPLETSYTPSAQ